MPVILTSLGATYTQNFDTLASQGSSNTLPIGWEITETGTNANGLYTAGTGGSNAGDVYSFGAAASTERALGSLLSGSLTPAFGASFLNSTSATITGLNLAYTGEMWRAGVLNRGAADRVDFQVSTDATSLTSGTWVDVNALDFFSPALAVPAGALDGNAAANRQGLSASIAGLTLAPGATVWIRWTDFNIASADDGLAVDDFSLTPTGSGAGLLSTVAVVALDGSAAEAGSDTGAFRFTRSGDVSAPLTVAFTVSGTASSTDDYTPALGNLVTFGSGQASVDVVIAALDDATPEATETVVITLTNAAEYLVGGAAAGVNIVDNDITPTLIRDIQGSAHRSPLVGQAVAQVPGIVTALAVNGFYLQDPAPDANDATSEGLFVFTSTAPTVAVGDAVQVSGTVTEFRPGGALSNNLSITEITSPVVAKLSSGNALPAAVVLGNGGRALPHQVIEDDAGNVETGGSFDPAQDGIDFWESLEGMRVQVNDPVATSPTGVFVSGPDTSEEIWVLADNGAGASSRTARGGSLITARDHNPERIQIDDLINGGVALPMVDVGARLGSSLTGVVNYDFGNYEVLVAAAPTDGVASTLTREVTSLVPTAGQLTVATFNVENLDANDPGAQFEALARRIVGNLGSPDILNLEEIQDNNGATNDATVDASATLNLLIAAIAAAGGPAYDYRQIDPLDDSNGGEPGGNIRVAFLFNPARVDFVDRPGGSASTATTVAQNGALSASPGLIDPANAAFTASRKPLVGEFVFNGQTVYLIGNHFNSKGGDQALFGANQPPVLGSEVQRDQQATVVAHFVKSLLAIDPQAKILVAGDLNDFEYSKPLSTLEAAGLNSLVETLPANERYSYNFEGQAQTLDHLLASAGLQALLSGYDVVHINSEFADQVSDHDPVLARFDLPVPQVVDGGSDRDLLVGGAGPDRITGGGGRDLMAGGAGGDTFVYRSLLDAGDLITDFVPGVDHLDLTALLALVGATGPDPVADGYLRAQPLSMPLPGGSAIPLATAVLFDADGWGSGELPRPLVLLLGVAVGDAAWLLAP